MVGCSNSRPSATSGTPSGVYEAGIDTARFLFRATETRDQLAAVELLTRPAKLGQVRAGYMAEREMVWVEGRARAALDGSGGLLPAGALGDAHNAVRLQLRDLGLDRVQPVGVSRVDATVTVRVDKPAEGWAILRGLASVDVPRRKPDVIGRPPETVYWLTPSGQRRERAYDKGLESGRARPGLDIRLEAQMRFQGPERTTVEWWNMDRVREGFEKRFQPMAAATEGLHVASEATLREQVRQLVDRGSITPGGAERLLGFIAAQSVGLRAPSRRSFYRRRAELRRLGLAQALDGADDVDVDLGAVLEDALTTGRWDG